MSEKEVDTAVDKLLGVKRFTVYARETVYYAIEVVGESEDEVLRLANNGEFEFPMDSIYDDADFEIDSVEELDYDSR